MSDDDPLLAYDRELLADFCPGAVEAAQFTSLVHFHIPRAAGSSLYKHLRETLTRNGIKFISEHMYWGDLAPAPGRLFLIVLRNPVERVESLAAYILSKPEHKKHERLRLDGVTAYLSRPGVESSQFCNGMTRLLAGREAHKRPVCAEDVDRAIAVLERPDVIVAFSDNLAGALHLIREKGGFDMALVPPRRNGVERLPPDEERRQAIARANHFDMELCRRVRKRLTRCRLA